jgi:hypothetical protein
MNDAGLPYVTTREIGAAVQGREEQILEGLGIRARAATRDHIDCPYPQHGGKND